LAFLLAEPVERGGVEVAVKADDGLAGWGLVVKGAVELVGRDLSNGRELHVELKAALEQHFVADGLWVEGVEQAGFFVGDEGFERGQLGGFIRVGVGRKIDAGEGAFFEFEDLEACIDGLRLVAITVDDALDAFDGDVADFLEAVFACNTLGVRDLWDLHQDKLSIAPVCFVHLKNCLCC